MIAIVGSSKTRELVSILEPVELAGINNAAANTGTMTIQILGGGVGDNVCAPLDGTAIYRGREGVVDNEGHTLLVRNTSPLFDVENCECGICDSLAEHCLSVGLEGRTDFILGGIRADEGELNAHLLHGYREKVVGSAVDGGGCYNMIAAGGNVKDCVKVSSLT